MEKWFKSHNYPYIKTKNGTYFWQTKVATGEMTPTGAIIWHEKTFFNDVVDDLLDNAEDEDGEDE